MVDVLIAIVKSAFLIVAFITSAAYLVLTERKVIGYFQVRMGPNRVGAFGLLQPLADVVKLLTKEDARPAGRDDLLYLAAPAVMTIASVFAFAVIPVTPTFSILGKTVTGYITNLNVGVLYIFAVSGMTAYGIVLGGYASNSKYSLLGAMRSAAQLISYEMALGFSLVGVFILAGTVNLNQIIDAQHSLPFIVLQPLGFAIYVISATAEVNRAPFDLPEAEQELVAGYLTEYGGLKWGLYFLGEYINMVTVSAIAATLFLGGWRGPLLPGFMWFIAKLGLMIFVFFWMRATLPRLRYDRLMALGWKVLLPLALLNIVVTATFVVFGLEWLIPVVTLAALVVVGAAIAMTQQTPAGVSRAERHTAAHPAVTP
ncbi:MAG TPA: NADH-quinone oxidoreductase subunit NuoH [Candidatus Dormibacteraeota bacterium]|nr:NADH-quinone oxidoreductase subunit NuoH [Candidatus Dormibacteraeota bacterium]